MKQSPLISPPLSPNPAAAKVPAITVRSISGFFEFSPTVKICGPLFSGILSIFRNYTYPFDFTRKLFDFIEPLPSLRT